MVSLIVLCQLAAVHMLICQRRGQCNMKATRPSPSTAVVQGDEMAAEVEPFCQQNLVNALGGCCGSRPEHIAAIVGMGSGYPARDKHGVGSVQAIAQSAALALLRLCTATI